MSLENRLVPEQRTELHPPTEVLDGMEGFRKFFKREGEHKYNPDHADIWVVAGLSGVGKSVAAGQLRVLIEDSRIREEKMAKTEKVDPNGKSHGDGKSPFIAVYPWDFFLSRFVKEDPTKIWGNLPVEDYNQGGEDMAMWIQRLKTLTERRNPNVALTFILPLPVFTGSRGGEIVLRTLSTDINLRVVALTARGQVLENAAIIRDALRQSKEAFLEALADHKVKIDKEELTDEEYEGLKVTMGTRESIGIHGDDLNERILESEEKLRKREKRLGRGNLPAFDREALRKDFNLRIMLQRKYYDYYLGEKLRIPKERYLITHNVFLGGEINFYLSKLRPPREDELPVTL